MPNEFGTAKSLFILAIVAGCFAILWPNVFYPMITGSYQVKNDMYSGGCCGVIFDKDMNVFKIMTEMCENILHSDAVSHNKSSVHLKGKLPKELLQECHTIVLRKCGIDIRDFLSDKGILGKSYKQNLDIVKTLNSSICLRESFGLPVGLIGMPRRIRIWGINTSKHMKQERPSHLHPEMMHPALREKGRAIPQTLVVPKVSGNREGVAGMRPPMGGAGHVVPPPRAPAGGGTMGLVMPMYTIGIVVFFLYTMMKLMFKKSTDSQSFDEFTSDSEFCREVFNVNHRYQSSSKEKNSNENTRLGDLELELLKERLQETEKAMERIVAKMRSLPQASQLSQEENSSDETKPSNISSSDNEPAENGETVETVENSSSPRLENESEEEAEESSNTVDHMTEECDEPEKKSRVKVVGMETTETCESGKWTPSIGQQPVTNPQNIFIPGVIPDQSQILVANSVTETVPDSKDSIVLSGKVTLSLIGFQEMDEATNTTETDIPNQEEDSSKLIVQEDAK